ncbi:uncharacterized protein LOC129732077 isoform X2 [Wyeomyia smithii]|uniref:uncharacterized protein LOC129732077 isoform X2 n=1 Tax=Wyeomyia smithii TaxID=174621 RepID=UPI002467B982|nr:uncharacterized protein LOC129732077 isoform X2 [Wyeomyia smithii]
METLKHLLLQTTASNISSIDDLLKDCHPELHPQSDPLVSSNGDTLSSSIVPSQGGKNGSDFIAPLPNYKQPPVIVGVAVKRTLKKHQQQCQPESENVEPSSAASQNLIDTLERWHNDIFELGATTSTTTAAAAAGMAGDNNSSSDCNINANQLTRDQREAVDGEGDLIDFSTEIVVAPDVQRNLKPKVKKVTFLLDDLLFGEEGNPDRKESGKLIDEERECKTLPSVEGEWDVSDITHGCDSGWRREEATTLAAGGNEISTETMQTYDIVSITNVSGHVDSGSITSNNSSNVRKVIKEKETVECACSSSPHYDGRERHHHCHRYQCQHLAGGALNGPESVSTLFDCLAVEQHQTALPTNSTNTYKQLDSDAQTWERKIDEIPEDFSGVESARKQNACAQTGNTNTVWPDGGSGKRLSVDYRASRESIDGSRGGHEDEGNIVDVQDESLRNVYGSTGETSTFRLGRTVSECRQEESTAARIDETDSSQRSLQPLAKEAENVVTSVPTGSEQLEFGPKNPPESHQLCEKSIQVPSPSHRGVNSVENGGQRFGKEVHFSQQENSYHKSSDSESENYYGTCSPPPPPRPPLVPPNGAPPAYGLNVEVTLNAHISVHGISEFDFFSSGDRQSPADPDGPFATSEKILKDCATNTNSGRNNNSNVTPSSADSGIIIIDDDIDDSGGGSGSAIITRGTRAESQICEHPLVLDDSCEKKKPVGHCRDQDTQTFLGIFPSPKKTSEISVQVCENGDSDLRHFGSPDSCASGSELEGRKNSEQFLRPPLSFLSEKQNECFEASNRLKRLEERFRGFASTKKLLRESLSSPATPSSGQPAQNLSSSLSSLSTLLADRKTNTNLTSQSLPVPASSTPSLTAAAREEQEQEQQSRSGRSFVPSWRTSSLSCLTKDDTQDQLSHLSSKSNVPRLPPLSSSLLSLSASSLLSLSCIDLERSKQRQQQQKVFSENNYISNEDQNDKAVVSENNYPPFSVDSISSSSETAALFKATSLPSLLPQHLFPPTRAPPRPPRAAPTQEQPLKNHKSSRPENEANKPIASPDEDGNPLKSTPLDEDYRPSLATPESSVESEEICKIFPNGKPRIEDPLKVVEPVFRESEDEVDEIEEFQQKEEEIEFSAQQSESEENQEFLNLEKLLAADPHTNCEFDTRHLSQYEPAVYQIKYCYDELEEELESEVGSVGGLLIGASDSQRASVSVSDENGCECVIEAVPIYRTLPLDMRETTGTLRGLLKKPNRPPPVRKNRVVFDETRNEFFEADYIILIREDCPYDEEDEEPCTCGEHELVRICCDEGCNCGYTDDGRTPPSPKFAPPIEFVDQATLSPPEGYKDGSGLLDNALGGALGGHVFGAQHIQQLQVIQRLQQQRAAMLAARAAAGQQGQQTGSTQTSQTGGSGSGGTGGTGTGTGQAQPPPPPSQQQQTVCTECAECAECAAKQLHDEECDSQCSDDISPLMEAPLPPHATLPIALVPLQKSSPERRITQKEIIAGEERPKFLTIKQVQDASQGDDDSMSQSSGAGSVPSAGGPFKGQPSPQRYIVETITMTTVTERRIIQKTQTDTEPSPPPTATTAAASIAIVTVTSSNETGSTAVPAAAALTGSSNNHSSSSGNNNNDLRAMQQKQLQQKQQQSGVGPPADQSSALVNNHYELGKHKPLSTAQAISGILKGGKLWKNEQQQQQQQQQHQAHLHQHSQQQKQLSAQHDDSTNVTSDEETSSKRSVRFTEESTIREACCDGEVQSGLGEGEMGTGKPINYMSDTLKRHSSSLFHNALRPNSAVRQLFPSSAISPLLSSAGCATVMTVAAATTTMATGVQMTAVNTTSASTAGNPTALTQEALKAFDDLKKPTLVHQHSITSNSSSSNINPAAAGSASVTAGGSPGGSCGTETDTIRRTIERNALRRSLIKYEPKKKIPVRDVTSLEERIRQLTCDIDDPIDEGADGDHPGHVGDLGDMERRDSPAGEENPQQPKYIPDKSFSPSSSASSSSSGSNGSTYKKITDLFHRDRRQEKIPEADENPIVIIPQVYGDYLQDCRCPAGPDIGMGVQIQGAHTQIHQPPQQRQTDGSRRQFLSTLAPLTACVAGQRDDLSYYTLAQPGDRNSLGSSQSTEYSLGDIDAALHDDDGKKVAPDVIAGTPGQESDELAAFVQQEGARTERLKKRYSAETSTSAPASGAGSDDDEHNDYGFNSRPSVRGIKPRFGSTNEILQQMQAQLAAPSPPQPKSQSSVASPHPIQSNTFPRPHTASSLQLAAAKQQITTHQHTASWSYYPVDQSQSKAVAAVASGTNMVAAVDPHGNYYHIPAQARHSYHGQEAIYQNCAQLPAGNIQANTVHVQSQQIHTQHHAVHTAHHIHQTAAAAAAAAAADPAAYGKFARSPTRRPESPPPLRNYHQTMVLIPYNAETYQRYTAQEQENYRRQHNIVTQQTIRVPVGYPLPGMQLHVVAGRGTLPPHYSTLPRLGSSSNPTTSAAVAAVTGPNVSAPQGKPPAYSQYPVEKAGVKFTERGAPEGAASVQPADAGSLLSPSSQGHGPPTAASTGPMTSSSGSAATGSNAQGQGAVFYAMNV